LTSSCRDSCIFFYSVTCEKSSGQATSISYLADSMEFIELQSDIGDSRIGVGHSVDNALADDTIDILIRRDTNIHPPSFDGISLATAWF
jgi:hypothetical protein